MGFYKWFKLPEKEEVQDLNASSTTVIHAQILKRKAFLRKLYEDFYCEFKNAVDSSSSQTLIEIGGGGGFIKEIIPNTITSDILLLPHIDICFSAHDMPFKSSTVGAFFMLNVFHHIKKPALFLEELDMCLKPGGKVIMIEPANTLWGRFIYKNFHHEVFDTSRNWSIEGEGPLSSANGAISWIIFFRDRKRFESEFPSLRIKKIRFHTPFRYLISGGFSLRQLLPTFTYGIIKKLETVLSPLNKYIGIFLTVEIERL